MASISPKKKKEKKSRYIEKKSVEERWRKKKGKLSADLRKKENVIWRILEKKALADSPFSPVHVFYIQPYVHFLYT